MPQFEPTGAHLSEHEEMHKGLDNFTAYLKLCSRQPKEYSPEKLRQVMQPFGEVLFHHLDAEVASLGPDSLRSAGWSLEELKAIPL